MYNRIVKAYLKTPQSFFLFGPRAEGTALNGLKLFKKDYPQAKCFLACGVPRREYHGGIEVWPFAELLRGLLAVLGAPSGEPQANPQEAGIVR